MKKPMVYIMANKNNTVLYTGVTSDLKNRVIQHKTKYYRGSFSSRYNCSKLVFFIQFSTIIEAISFEKKIKAGNRLKKEKLINEMNPDWKDLAEDWVSNF
ncbi:MAG: GIY-YIG nuclease family protein [Gramella sp.]|nr:GIY-YIG nuclease family protein [Christiangramia sp.]MBT8319312.1 GIY-YIG nuclease family protein [Christiangramia sp.]